MRDFKVKEDFLWGSASAAYQVEGAHLEDGKGASNWDEFVKIPGKTFKATTGEIAVDHYHRYKEDIALMAEMGLETYRFSVSWARVIPDGNGEVNEAGIKFYENIIDECIKYGIEPMVTIYHWDLPKALDDQYGGWESEKIIDDYVNYCKVLFERFIGKVKYWITLNEQNVFTSLGWVTAMHPPGKFNEEKLFYKVNHHANLAHAKAVILYKEMCEEKNITGNIGASFAYSPCYAKDCDPLNGLAKMNFEDLQNYWWMDIYAFGRYPKAAYTYLERKGVAPVVTKEESEILKKAAGLIDFMGVNYYQTAVVAHNPADGATQFGKMNTTGVKGSNEERGVPGVFKYQQNPYLSTTDWDWTIDPDGLKLACRIITSRYDLPIVISENGLGAFDKLEKEEATGEMKIHDPYRVAYLEAHVKSLIEAMEEGCEVLAYCTWSFTDLLSWLNGYQKRYGFVYVDRDEVDGTLNRYKKDSYYWYKDVIATNGSKLIDNSKDDLIM